jgi:hypothetical protein
VLPKGLDKCKNSFISLALEPTTFWLVAWRLNHYATACIYNRLEVVHKLKIFIFFAFPNMGLLLSFWLTVVHKIRNYYYSATVILGGGSIQSPILILTNIQGITLTVNLKQVCYYLVIK